jgi:hypothetical protein
MVTDGHAGLTTGGNVPQASHVLGEAAPLCRGEDPSGDVEQRDQQTDVDRLDRPDRRRRDDAVDGYIGW